MLTDSFFCHYTSTEGSYHRQFGNVPDSQSSAYRRKYIHLFKLNVLSAHIKQEVHRPYRSPE